MSPSLPLRLKRLRRSHVIRALVRENHIRVDKLIAPLFINESINQKKAIQSMPGQFQLALSDLPEAIDELLELGIQAVLLFGIPKTKDDCGSFSFNDDGIVQQSIKIIREKAPDMLIIADACFCEYTDHGHCGVLDDEIINNDKTLELLGQQAVSLASAGADWIAPSGMTDGMVNYIRCALDKAGHIDVAILSYAVKYSSSFYGPFREAAEGAPQFGDRKTYQMDPANAMEAIREAELDLSEGADMLMVKPAMNYLDVIYRIKQAFPEVPLCAYQVSGEYAMLKFAASKGLINETEAMLESILAIKRAGADMIITYFAKDLAKALQ